MDSGCANGIDTGFVVLGYAKVAVLGVVQGITELMPISSTAHMRIVPALLGWPDPGSAFSAAMQLAALTAVISYFWRDVWDPIFGSLSAIARRDYHDRSFVLAVRSMPTPTTRAGSRILAHRARRTTDRGCHPHISTSGSRSITRSGDKTNRAASCWRCTRSLPRSQNRSSWWSVAPAP